MRVLLVSSSSGSRGGGELFLLYLAEGLRKRGHEPILWCAEHPRMDELAGKFTEWGKVVREPYVNTYDRPLRSLNLGWTLGGAEKWASSWQRLKPDVIHLNKQNVEDGLDLLAATDRVGVPAVCTVHLTQSPVYLGARLGRLRAAVAARALRRFAGDFAAIDPVRAEELRSFAGGRARVALVANGIAFPETSRLPDWRREVRGELGCNDDTQVALAVGRLEAQKDPLRFLDWVRQLHTRECRLRAFWLGDGRMREEMERAIGEHGLAGTVKVLGWRDDVGRYLAGADVLLHSARYEGLPLAILEAMAHGLPCVLSRELAEGIAGLRDAPGVFLPVESDGSGLESCLDEATRKKTAESARRLAEAEFSLEAMARRYEDLYRTAAQDVRE